MKHPSARLPASRALRIAPAGPGAAGWLLLFGLLLLPASGRAQQWRAITPTGEAAPSPRAHVAAIYDPVEHRVVIFGGRGDGGVHNDVWALDLDTEQWTDLTPALALAPPPRSTPAGVYDEAGGQMLIWSGQGSGFYQDVWGFDLSAHTWTDHTPTTTQPNRRYGVAAVFDPRARSLVTFAGFTDQGRFEDTWVFDVEDGAWSEVTPGTGPARRCLHTASYDARRHRMLMYGGQRSGPLDDLWAFDLDAGTWTELATPTRPDGRYFPASVYDPEGDRLLVFGGNRGSLGLSDELWAVNLSDRTWDLLSPSGTPPTAREGAAAVYIPQEHRVIVFGGRGGSYLNDVWSLDLPAATATEPNEAPPAEGLKLFPNYPNPVGATTTITFELARPMPVALAIYDLLGREVRRLADGPRDAGRHTVAWDGRDASGRRLASGVYRYALHGDDRVRIRQLVLVR